MKSKMPQYVWANIKVSGGKKFERDLAKKTVIWSIEQLGLSKIRKLNISIKIKKLSDCTGYCQKEKERLFIIAVDNNQTLRNFVMTVIHEMIHVKQYIRKKWYGDGEQEAWGLQEDLTNEIWKDNVI